MKNKNAQQELFKEYGAPKKRGIQNSILPKSYTLLNISYEQLIFLTIAIIMLMVLVFSLGVERGRSLAEPLLERADTTIVEVTKETKEEVTDKVPVKEEGLRQLKKLPELFTVQVIAYRSKKSAQRELERLGKKGYKPFIIVGGNYYQICVGEYKNEAKAKEELLELRKTYKDSFVRKR